MKPWLRYGLVVYSAFVLGFLAAHRVIVDPMDAAYDLGYQNGYWDGTEAQSPTTYEPMPILPILAVFGGVAGIVLLIGVVKMVHHAWKPSKPESSPKEGPQ